MRHLLSVLALTASTLAAAGPIDELANDTWTQAESKHFRVVTDQPEATARLMLTDLEILRTISSRVRGVETLDVAPPLTILAIGKPGNFERLGMRDSLGGQFVIGRDGFNALADVSGYISNTEQSSPARTTLLHEYHHALMRLTLRTLAMPLWYDEGMAEYWSSLTIEDGFATFGRSVEGLYREDYMFNQGGAIRLDTRSLFNRRELNWDNTDSKDDTIDRFYAQARYTIHYFHSTPELRAQLERYIELYNQGISQDKAAQLAFKLSYAELNKEIIRYLKRKMVVRGFKMSGVDFRKIDMRVTRLDKNATWAVFAEVLPRHVGKDKMLVRTVLETNLKHNPDSPQAYRLHLSHLGGVGLPDISELVKRFPNDAGLHAMHGEGLRMYGNAMRATGLDGWTAQMQQARHSHLRANQLDPSHPLPFWGLGEIHAALPGKDGLDEGISTMDTAVIYERSPAALRKLARLHLRAGKLSDALTAMRGAVAFHDGEQVAAFDVALQENLELMTGPVAPGASATATGLAWPDGSTYTGPVRGLKPAGSGTYVRVSGSYYEGGFDNGLPHGKGKLVSERGLVFEGSFDKGVARGVGRLSMAGGGPVLSYEGEVDHMLPSGTGSLVTATGRYDGQLLDGMRHGTGTFTPAAASTKLRGTWRLNGFDFPALNNVLFTGVPGKRGEPDGGGWCRPVGKPQELAACYYHDGKLISASAPTPSGQ